MVLTERGNKPDEVGMVWLPTFERQDYVAAFLIASVLKMYRPTVLLKKLLLKWTHGTHSLWRKWLKLC